MILLGGSRFPFLESVESSEALRKSSECFKAYIQAEGDCLHCPSEQVLDLFDADKSPAAQLEEIHLFIDQFSKKTAVANGFTIRNLIIYYVGHGLILGSEGEFGLAVNYTKSSLLLPTCIVMSHFSETIKSPARYMRKFLIIDCCFAGKMVVDWLPGDSASTLAEIVRRSTVDEFGSAEKKTAENPRRGTAVLCAADKDSVAIGSHPSGMTLFTGAMLDALSRIDSQDLYSLQDLYDRTWQCIQEASHSVRPVVFSPDQREGDISRLQLFPRRNRGGKGISESRVERQPEPPDKEIKSNPIYPPRHDPVSPPTEEEFWIWVTHHWGIFMLAVFFCAAIVGFAWNEREKSKPKPAPVSDLNFGRLEVHVETMTDQVVDFVSYDPAENLLTFNYQSFDRLSDNPALPIENIKALISVNLQKVEIDYKYASISLVCRYGGRCVSLKNISGKCYMSDESTIDHDCLNTRSEITIGVDQQDEKVERLVKALKYYSSL